MLDQYLSLGIPRGAVQVTVKLEDEGVVLDVLNAEGNVVATTWKLYPEFGKNVVDDRDDTEVVFVIASSYRTFEAESYDTRAEAEARMVRIAQMDPSGYERGLYWITSYER